MNLREWLFKKRMRIKYFSAVIRVDRTYIYRWMKGELVPSEDIMKRIREISLDEVYKTEDLKDVEVKRNETQKEDI